MYVCIIAFFQGIQSPTLNSLTDYQNEPLKIDRSAATMQRFFSEESRRTEGVTTRDSLWWRCVEHGRETPSLQKQQQWGPHISTHLMVSAEGPVLCGSHTKVSTGATSVVICVVFLAAWPPSLTLVLPEIL